MTLWVLRVGGTPHTFRTSGAATRYARIARALRPNVRLALKRVRLPEIGS